MKLINAPTAAEITERLVAIVQFGPPTDSDGLHPARYYQVTIDPKRFSQCGQYIRFGSYPGDEITGWQRADCIYMISELSKWPETIEEIKIRWWDSPALEHIE